MGFDSMNRLIKEESKLPLFQSENKLLIFYFLIPLLLGKLLGDGVGIDISQTATKYIGLLSFIQKAGIDIRSKSMIFVLYLVFAPCYWHCFFKLRKSIPPPANQLKTASVSRILALIVAVLFMGLGFSGLIFYGLHESHLITPDRRIRSLLFLSQGDISFSILSGAIVWVWAVALYAPFVFTKELLQRLKNRNSQI
jgi:hypothetical protein